MPEVKIKRLTPDAVLPFRGSKGAAAWDITALDVKLNVVQTQGGARQPRAWWITTGLAVEIPEGYCMKIYARSGLGTANFLRPSNCVAIIDSDYRGEIKLRMIADEGGLAIEPKAGMVIAQAVIEKVEPVTWTEVDELSETDRGDNGFGSTTPAETDPTPTADSTPADDSTATVSQEPAPIDVPVTSQDAPAESSDAEPAEETKTTTTTKKTTSK
ncbi:dUTP diphosphatase [Pantoea sp. ICBG 1758]|uniref:dUTP diphosphatase n=1 Tax=Pantoea sp. ICBG 1758 TaxID=2071682 RepID=UPI000CE4D7F3|nr:dUTP diphosphatase [Pantoea sp. ICBG 1758]PPC61308.1 dUTP diphosphatase [Pantoea sp. ICBG 1758]